MNESAENKGDLAASYGQRGKGRVGANAQLRNDFGDDVTRTCYFLQSFLKPAVGIEWPQACQSGECNDQPRVVAEEHR